MKINYKLEIIFLLKICTIKLSFIVPSNVTWCARLVQTTDLNFAYDVFDGTNKHEASGTAITSYVLSGWQYVGFSIAFTAGTPPTITGNACRSWKLFK